MLLTICCFFGVVEHRIWENQVRRFYVYVVTNGGSRNSIIFFLPFLLWSFFQICAVCCYSELFFVEYHIGFPEGRMKNNVNRSQAGQESSRSLLQNCFACFLRFSLLTLVSKIFSSQLVMEELEKMKMNDLIKSYFFEENLADCYLELIQFLTWTL